MKDMTPTTWGYLIAFLLPGVLGVYGLSYWFPPAGAMLQPILKADATVGPSVVFLLIAVGTGLCLSAARYFLLENWLYGKKHRLSDELHKSQTPDKFTLFRAYAEEHYRYHQFYGGCCVAVLIWFAGWCRAQWPFKGAVAHMAFVTGIFLLGELLLERASYDAFKKYVRKSNALVPVHAAALGKGAGK